MMKKTAIWLSLLLGWQGYVQAQNTPPSMPPPPAQQPRPSPGPSAPPPLPVLPPSFSPSFNLPAPPKGASSTELKIYDLEIERFELKQKIDQPLDVSQYVTLKFSLHEWKSLLNEQNKSVASLDEQIKHSESWGDTFGADMYRSLRNTLNSSIERIQGTIDDLEADIKELLSNSEEQKKFRDRLDEIEKELADLNKEKSLAASNNSEQDENIEGISEWTSDGEPWPEIAFDELTLTGEALLEGETGIWNMQDQGGSTSISGGTPDPMADLTKQEFNEYLQSQANWEAGIISAQTSILEGANMVGIGTQTVISFIPGLTTVDIALSASRGFAETLGEEISKGRSFSEAAGKAAISGGFEGAISYVGNRLTAGADKLADRVMVLSDVGVTKLTTKQISEMGAKGFTFIVVKTSQSASQIASSMMLRSLGEAAINERPPSKSKGSTSNSGFGFEPFTPVLR